MKLSLVFLASFAISCAYLPLIEAATDSRFPVIQVGRKLRSCISKLICELASSPLRFGRSGMRLVSSFLTKLNLPTISGPFYDAFKMGRRSSPDYCVEKFADCSTPSADLVRIGNDLIGEDGEEEQT